MCSSPNKSKSGENVNSSPLCSSTLPSLNNLTRISGPLVSSNIGRGMPSSSLTFFTRSILTFCSSCVPWEKLSLAQSRPFWIICFKRFSSSHAGPNVQIILVLRNSTTPYNLTFSYIILQQKNKKISS